MRTITTVRVEPNFKLSLTYSDGRTIVSDIQALIKRGGVFAKLSDPKLFAQVQIGNKGRSIQWSGEIDLCADALWLESNCEKESYDMSQAS